jgi:hypothetical protein
MKRTTATRERIILRIWQLASTPPEKTRGRLKSQIDACKMLHEYGYPPAIQMLNDIANMDTSRTGGRETDQKAAARLLKKIVGSITPDSGRMQ